MKMAVEESVRGFSSPQSQSSACVSPLHNLCGHVTTAFYREFISLRRPQVCERHTRGGEKRAPVTLKADTRGWLTGRVRMSSGTDSGP